MAAAAAKIMTATSKVFTGILRDSSGVIVEGIFSISIFLSFYLSTYPSLYSSPLRGVSVDWRVLVRAFMLEYFSFGQSGPMNKLFKRILSVDLVPVPARGQAWKALEEST